MFKCNKLIFDYISTNKKIFHRFRPNDSYDIFKQVKYSFLYSVIPVLTKLKIKTTETRIRLIIRNLNIALHKIYSMFNN